METKMIFLVAVLIVAGEVHSATFYSTHGSRAPGISASVIRSSRLRTRKAPTGATQQPTAYAYQQQRPQQQQDPAGGPYPSGNLIFYPAHGSNPLVAQQQYGLQNPQSTQPLSQQQSYQQQQLYSQQQLYQQQPEVQYQQQQQDPSQPTDHPIPGGVRYIFTSGQLPAAQLVQRRPVGAAPQVVEPAPSTLDPAPGARNPGQIGVSYSPAAAVSSIKFSNPYANYSYG